MTIAQSFNFYLGVADFSISLQVRETSRLWCLACKRWAWRLELNASWFANPCFKFPEVICRTVRCENSNGILCFLLRHPITTVAASWSAAARRCAKKITKKITAKCGGFWGPNLLGTFTHTSGDCRCLDSCFHVYKVACCQTGSGDPDWRSCYLSQGYGFGRSQTRPLRFFFKKLGVVLEVVARGSKWWRWTISIGSPAAPVSLGHITSIVLLMIFGWCVFLCSFWLIGGARCVSIQISDLRKNSLVILAPEHAMDFVDFLPP